MKTIAILAALAVAGSLVPFVNADHDIGCEPSSADPASYNRIDLPDGTILYVEERAVGEPANTNPPVPGSGFVLGIAGEGEGTWIYQESNGVDGLQRGGTSIPCLPAEDPCLVTGVDPVNDENCGHGPDTILF